MAKNNSLTECSKGHFYDSTLHGKRCPHCPAEGVDLPEETMPYQTSFKGDASTVGWDRESHDDVTVPWPPPAPANADAHSPTFLPVVGWLVCVEGPSLGRDYRLGSHRNFIGRSRGMDILIENDNSVSREVHAEINYDANHHVFYVKEGQTKMNTYLNDRLVGGFMELKHGDLVQVGKTKLMFVPFCDKESNWENISQGHVPVKRKRPTPSSEPKKSREEESGDPDSGPNTYGFNN